jgi:hypothetical protein
MNSTRNYLRKREVVRLDRVFSRCLPVNKPCSDPQKFSRRFWLLLLCAGLGLLLASPGNAADLQVEPTGAMIQPRINHTATLLPDGKVLVAGGSGDDGILATAELYDPATGNWNSTGSLAEARRFHTATLLQNGLVLVVGGWDANFNPLKTAELYDPVTETWTPTGELHVPTFFHTATLLPDGRVLVAGGYGGHSIEALTRAELYDPVTGTWSVTADMLTAHSHHTATLLLNGEVLVVGNTENGSKHTELYDPATESWTSTGPLHIGRSDHTAAQLADGKVLVVGGYSIHLGVLGCTELYDSATGLWTSGGRNGRRTHWFDTETLLTDGTLLVVGGRVGFGSDSYADILSYDEARRNWKIAGELNYARYNHTATLLQNGSLLIAGGQASFDGPAVAIAELIEPVNGR